MSAWLHKDQEKGECSISWNRWEYIARKKSNRDKVYIKWKKPKSGEEGKDISKYEIEGDKRGDKKNPAKRG